MKARFKIDICKSWSTHDIGLFVKRWFGWKEIGRFSNVAEAKANYDNIKDLPEYLP
jgi:hypothetical protein